MEPIEQMRNDGAGKGLCRLYQLRLRDGLSVKDLSDLYKGGMKFCIDNDFPTLDFLREHYRGKCEEYGVYIDDAVAEELHNPDTVVMNGESVAFFRYNEYTVSQLYVRHTSKAAVVVGGNAIVTISLFDDAELVISKATEAASVHVKVYGRATVRVLGRPIEIEYKHKNTI
jgi:molybdopterin converting factor small subunit